MFKARTATILAATALVVAVFGATPLGHAAGSLILVRNSVGTAQLKKNAVTGPRIQEERRHQPEGQERDAVGRRLQSRPARPVPRGRRVTPALQEASALRTGWTFRPGGRAAANREPPASPAMRFPRRRPTFRASTQNRGRRLPGWQGRGWRGREPRLPRSRRGQARTYRLEAKASVASGQGWFAAAQEVVPTDASLASECKRHLRKRCLRRRRRIEGEAGCIRRPASP
jgi:hypothetical protein